MAQDKKKVIVYADWIIKFEVLNDEEAGRLIKHFFRYINDLNPTYPDRITEISFLDIQNTLKRDLKKWEKRAESSRENGKNGGRPQNPKKPTETQQVILQPKKPVIDIDSDSDSVIVKDIKLKDIKEKTIEKIVFIDGFKEIVERWLKYKSDRKESYKSEDSIDTFYRNLLKLSNSNPKVAIEIIEQSISNNWAGIFELKNNQQKADDRYEILNNGTKRPKIVF
ncbi:DUF6291 domain-containing protein [uncultured Flavobacterium sp.]|uniref:DUF6291 domain-containing protein n=1 Tax=uncultured Flavobacterium sp. TaxID=165435 RepID=UPI002592DCD5|nr:DUF6291 domain-containing protein [uncultured Flavobacterium sp.]